MLDVAGNELSVGQRVAISVCASHLDLGTVYGFTPKKVKVVSDKWGEVQKFPVQLAVIQSK